MEWQLIVALVVGVPFILLPVAFVWYLNVGGLYKVMREARAKRIARVKRARVLAEGHA